MPTIVPLLGQFPVLTMLSGNGKGKNGVPAEVVPEVLVLLVPEVLLPLVLPEVLPLVLPEVLPLVLPEVLLPDVLVLEKTGEPNLPRPSVDSGRCPGR